MLRAVISGSLLAALAWVFVDDARGAPPAVRRVRLKYHCEIAKLPDGAKTVDLWIPVPSADERQSVRLLNETELGAGRFTTDKKFGNRMYYRRFAAGAGEPIKVELLYEAEAREAAVPAAKSLIATTQVKPGPEMAPYLGEVKMIPIAGPISQLAAKIKLPEGEPLRAGRAVYDYLIDTMVYNYLAKGAGDGNAVWACDSKTGDCTDYNSVFMGVCRWRGIPADHVFGLPMPPEKPEGEIKYCHCWARFWVADVGWIPLDPSRADKFPDDREYYFGTLGSTWLTLTHGRDVVLEPPQQGQPVNMFTGPVAEVDGQPFAGVKWLGYYQDLNDAAAAK